MSDRQASANPLLDAQPHSPEVPTHGTHTDFGATAGLTIILLTMLNADTLELVDLELKDFQRPCHEGNE